MMMFKTPLTPFKADPSLRLTTPLLAKSRQVDSERLQFGHGSKDDNPTPAPVAPPAPAYRGPIRRLWDFLVHHNQVNQDTCPQKEKSSLFKLGGLLWGSVLVTAGGMAVSEHIENSPMGQAKQHIDSSFNAHQTLVHLKSDGGPVTPEILLPHAQAHLSTILKEVVKELETKKITPEALLDSLSTLPESLNLTEQAILLDILKGADHHEASLAPLKKSPTERFHRFVDELLIPRLYQQQNLSEEDGKTLAHELKTMADKEFSQFPKQKLQHLLLYALIGVCLYVGVKGGLLTASMKTKRYSGGLEAALLFPLELAKKIYTRFEPLWNETPTTPTQAAVSPQETQGITEPHQPISPAIADYQI